MPTRTESLVYFPQRIEVDRLLAWLADVNRSREAGDRVALFEVLLTAIARTLMLRPEMNRFIAGRRTYQHADISISFVVKQGFRDDAAESEARIVFTGRESVDEVHRLVHDIVHRERSGDDPGDDDKLIELFASAPRPVLAATARAVRWLDYHNLMPVRLMQAIPLYTSVYVVNAGSIGIPPPFHHLYEYGTASVFVAIGQVAPQPVVAEDGQVVARTCVDLVYTLDERASDGFYFAKTAEVFRRLVSEPDLLADPGIRVEDIVPVWPPRR